MLITSDILGKPLERNVKFPVLFTTMKGSLDNARLINYSYNLWIVIQCLPLTRPNILKCTLKYQG